MEVDTNTLEAASSVQSDTNALRSAPDFPYNMNKVREVVSVDETEMNSFEQTSCNNSDVNFLKCSSSVPSGMTDHAKPDPKTKIQTKVLIRASGISEDMDKLERDPIYTYEDKLYTLQVRTKN